MDEIKMKKEEKSLGVDVCGQWGGREKKNELGVVGGVEG